MQLSYSAIMLENAQYPPPLPPLNVGNVVSAAIRLYRSHLKSYFGIAFVASLWSFLPLIALLLLIVLGSAVFARAFLGNTDGSPWGILILAMLILIPIWLTLAIFCWGKSLMNTALISRLAALELANQPESVAEARRQLKSKTWIFLWLQFVVSCLLGTASFFLSAITSIVFNYPATIIAGTLENGGDILAVLLTGLGYLTYYAAYFWIYAHLFIPEVLLAVELNTTMSAAIERCWKFSHGFVWHIVAIATIVLLVSVPVYLFSVFPMLLVIFSFAATFPDGPGPEVIGRFVIAFFLTIALFFGINIFLIPLGRRLKAFFTSIFATAGKDLILALVIPHFRNELGLLG
ncbi:MAG: hypothetical protein HC890_15800 [Chloroflexaceae bacterium]|nr:hypothetical protein [Chloroflexaceae bacterium]